MFNKHDTDRDSFMLTGSLRRKGYDWWWHSFTARNEKTGSEKPFFIEFYICNPALGGKEPVFGQLPENQEKGIRPSYLMVKAGCWGEEHMQLHRFFGIDEISIHPDPPYSVSAGDCFASETALKGSISITESESSAHPEYMCDSGSMSWDLTVDKQISFNVGYGASGFFRDVKAFEMYWHAEGMKTFFSGTIILNGEKYIVTPESSYGYADKNWGRDFTSPWVWLSSCCMKSRITGRQLSNSVFDIGGGRPKIYSVALERKLLGAFYYEGEELEFNFSKFWTAPKTEFDCRETETEILWHVRMDNRDSFMIVDISCKKSDMLLVNYEAPDGKKRHNRLWNGGNGTGRVQLFSKNGTEPELIDDIDVSHVGCEYGVYDTEE